MNGFLSRLAGRVLSSEAAIRPRLPALFESASSAAPIVEEEAYSEQFTAREAVPGPVVARAELPVISRVRNPQRTALEESGDSLAPPLFARTSLREMQEPASAQVLQTLPSDAGEEKPGHVLLSEPRMRAARDLVSVEAKIARQPYVPDGPDETPPAVNVTIGRIEVRAIHRSEPPRMQPSAPPQQPSLSLDDYLLQRRRGLR